MARTGVQIVESKKERRVFLPSVSGDGCQTVSGSEVVCASTDTRFRGK